MKFFQIHLRDNPIEKMGKSQEQTVYKGRNTNGQ